MLKTHKFSDLLPYYAYEGGVFHNQNSLGFVLETVPLVGAGEEIQHQLNGLIQHTLPAGSSLQILLMASPHLDSFYDHWQHLRQGDLFKTFAEERVKFLNQKEFRNFRVLIAYSEPGVDLQKRVQEVLKQVKGTFEGFGLPVNVWGPEELIRSLDGFLNPLFLPLTWKEEAPIRDQIFSSSFQVKVLPTHLEINDRPLEMYSVRVFPNQWYLGAMGNLIGDLFNTHLQIKGSFFIHYGIHIVKDKLLRTKIEAKTTNLERIAGNHTLMKWVPSLRREVEEGQFLRHKLEEGHRAVRTRFQIGFWGNEASSLVNLFRSNRWELERDQHIVLPSLISCFPMTWGEGMSETNTLFKATKTTLSHEPSNLMPIQGEWTGTKTPGMILFGRRGQGFYWCPFDNNAGNYNVSVVGRSGSGKSVFMQELMTSTLGLGGKVFVLDVGRSFEKTAQFLKGGYIEFSTASTICINPFSTVPVNAGEHTEDALAMIKPLVSLMASPLQGTNDLENAYIEQGLRDAWNQKGRDASITEVAEFLLSHKDKIANDLGNKLYPYTREGIYGRFFNGVANVDLTSNLTVIELEELKERKDLQAVVVQVVILQITNQLYMGDRKTKSHLVLDEAWDLLRAKQAGEFIETAARRLRKYNGSLVVGTQSVNDFYQTPGAQAAFDNSDWLCLLSQKSESIDFLEKTNRLSMDPFMKDLLKSVHTKQGEYAEVMIYGPHGYGVGRLYLDPFSKVLYSTKADDYRQVKDYQSKGMTLEEAVRKVANQ